MKRPHKQQIYFNKNLINIQWNCTRLWVSPTLVLFLLYVNTPRIYSIRPPNDIKRNNSKFTRLQEIKLNICVNFCVQQFFIQKYIFIFSTKIIVKNIPTHLNSIDSRLFDFYCKQIIYLKLHNNHLNQFCCFIQQKTVNLIMNFSENLIWSSIVK